MDTQSLLKMPAIDTLFTPKLHAGKFYENVANILEGLKLFHSF